MGLIGFTRKINPPISHNRNNNKKIGPTINRRAKATKKNNKKIRTDGRAIFSILLFLIKHR